MMLWLQVTGVGQARRPVHLYAQHKAGTHLNVPMFVFAGALREL